jgi:PAS domain-containing protein
MKNWKKYLFIFLGTAVYCLAGFYASNYFQKNNEVSIRNEILNISRVTAAAVNTENLKKLTVTPADNNIPEYQRLRVQLSNLYQALKEKGISGIYTMSLKGENIVFSVDSWATSDQLHSEPGDLYKKPPSELYKVFSAGTSEIVGPYTDEFGTWLSAFSPIKDTNGNIIQVVGTDIIGSYYLGRIQTYKTYSYLIVLAVYLLIALLYLYILSVMKGFKKSKESIKLFNDLTNSVPLCIQIFDSRGKLISINKYAKKAHFLTSLTDAEIKKWDFMSCIKEEYRSKVQEALNLAMIGKGTQDMLIGHIPGTSTSTWCLSDFVPIENDGKIEFIYYLGKNIDREKFIQENLENQKRELEKINNIMIDREVKMIELKERIKELEGKK